MGPFDQSEVEGTVTVKPRSSAVIRVQEEDFSLDCESGNLAYSFAYVTGRRGDDGHVVRRS